MTNTTAKIIAAGIAATFIVGTLTACVKGIKSEAASETPAVEIVEAPPESRPESNITEEVSQLTDEPDEQEKEQQSEEWKRAVIAKAREHYDIQVSNYRDNGFEYGASISDISVSLCNLNDGSTVGVDFWYDGSLGEASRGGQFYRFINGSLEQVTNWSRGVGLRYNSSTGVIDVVSELHNHGMVIYYAFEDGIWFQKISASADSGVLVDTAFSPYYLYDKDGNREEYHTKGQDNYDPERFRAFQAIYEKSINANRSPYEFPKEHTYEAVVFNDAGRTIQWETFAADLSDFLDRYDGINTDIASKEGLRAVAPQGVPEWADAYANLVRVIREKSPLVTGSFILMDMRSTGTPDLLVSYYPQTSAPQEAIVFDTALAIQYTINDDLTWGENPIYFPLRYFKNDRTGEIIFSTYNDFWFKDITYFNLSNFNVYRYLLCETGFDPNFGPDPNIHRHELKKKNIDGYDYDLIEALDSNEKSDECDIGKGRNSSDPTVVALVNKALEGYTEIPMPQKYTLDIPDENEGIFNVKEVQDWIYSVVAEFAP